MRDDADLLRACAEGDREALEVLFRRHAPWLTARLRNRCPNEALVDDLVQETFLAVWRGAGRFRERPGAEVAAWVWRIASHKMLDAVRRSGSRQRLFQALLRGLRRDEPSAEEEVLLRIEHGDVAGALARLSPELRAVVQATVIDGLSTREAAALLGIPDGTVKTRAMRARRQLRGELA